MRLKKTDSQKPKLQLGDKKNIFSGKNESEPSEKKFTDLRSVMDYSRDFSMFFSGVENDTYFKGCYEMGVRDFLMSYHYLQGLRVPLEKKYGGLGIEFFIDSGVYTYQNDPKYMEYDIEHWEQHIQKYLKWVEKNRDYIFAIANVDLENVVGGDVVLEWNEKYFEPFMLRTGIPVCFVWHVDSSRTWEQYCQRYPYVGFSSVIGEQTLDISGYVKYLKIAEKYNTLVHGFGMTKTSLLPQLPYYTVDSTSWKAGFMYGQLAFWNGKKVQMLRKEDFERAFKYIRQYDLDPPIDEELIYNYYEPEVLRANVYAYLQAVTFIRNSLKPKTYWKKPKTTKRTEEDISSIDFPSVDWLFTPQVDSESVAKYAKEFNISTENMDDAENFVIDMTCFMNWNNPDYGEYIKDNYTPEVIKGLHDLFVNRIVESDEERVTDLIEFYKENLLGNDTTLLYFGTNFDRMVKERDSYIDDSEYEYEDVSEMELQNTMSKYLPAPKEGSPAPEIDDLDDEIFRENEIIPVRDAQGHFLKGQKKVLRPKKMYSNKYPKLACDTCMNAQTCPEYKSGYVCAYNKMFERYNTRDMGDVIQAMQGIADYSLVRLQRAMLSETMNGGIPDPAVSQMMNQAMSLMSQMQRMYEAGSQEVIRQTKVLRSDGSQEMTTQVSNPQSGGILEKIFGNIGQEPYNPQKEVTVEAEVTE